MNKPRRKRGRKRPGQTDASGQAEKPISWCRGKTVASAISLFMLAIVFSPIKEHFREPHDDFPLSHYPMFTKRRDGDVTVTYLVGMDDKGRQYPIKYTFAGTGGFNQVRKQIRTMVRQRKAGQLVRRVAARVARESDGPEADLISVAVVTGTFRYDDFMTGNKTPTRHRVRARFPVTRTAAIRE